MCAEKFQFQADGPYPEVEVAEKNYAYAGMIAEAYAGRESELTAILQYSDQDFLKHSADPDLSDILSGIAKVEMHHLDLLGCLLVELGSLPVYAGRRRQMFSAGAVNYETDPVRFLNADLEGEYAAIDYYRYINARIEDVSINRLIDRIIEDEKVHVKIFKTLLEQRCFR